MDHTLNRDRSSNHQEETDCFKRTRVKNVTGRDELSSDNDRNLESHKTNSFQAAVSNGNSKGTFKAGEDKGQKASNQNIEVAGNPHKMSKSNIQKKSRFREKKGNGDDYERISSPYLLSSVNRGDEKLHERLNHAEITPIPSKQIKYTFQNRREINGCRPKQKMPTYIEAYVSKTQSGRNDKENKKMKDLMFGTPFLNELIGKGPAVIVNELTRSLSSLKNGLKRATKDEDFLGLFLQVLAEAFMSGTTSTQMISLFDALKESRFFEILETNLVSMIIRITTGKIEGHVVEPVLRNIMRIIVEQITRNPSSVYLFRKIHALLGQVIDELAKYDSVDDEILSEYQQLSEHRKITEKEQKEFSVEKQYPKPSDDFRQYSISPTADEITSRVSPPIRPNKVDGKYEDLHDYLDVHFRLLREDFIAPLREGMTQYIDMITSNKGTRKTKDALNNLDIKVYENVRVHSPVLTQQGICYKLQIKMTSSLRRIEWKFSKRLIYGSMVCLTDMNFNDFFLATVVEREERDIKRGLFTVHFERENVTTEDVLHKVFRMAETTGYFESYKHVLLSLQSFKDGDLPFEKYIVGCIKETDPPAYLTPMRTYDLRPLVYPDVELQESRNVLDNIETVKWRSSNLSSNESNTAKNVCVTDLKSWPSNELLYMDKSQYEAVQNALTNEVAIIQGPPGTGKTYIGLQIVKALLHNKFAWAGFGLRKRPMLVVCYTNHALDQFLEGIIKFFKGNILRVGGRSNSTELEKFNLKTYRKENEKKGSTLARLKFEKRKARRVMELRSRSVQRLTKTIQVFQTEIVREDVLLPEMGDSLYRNLIRGSKGSEKEQKVSHIVKWLEIEQIKKECMKQMQKEVRKTRTKRIQVDDETCRIQKDRMIDTWEDLRFSANEHHILTSIREDIAFYVPDTKPIRRKKTDDFQLKYLKLLKSSIIDKISDEDIMSQEEADTVKDIWGLDHDTKWRLYRLWIQRLCTKLYEKIEKGREIFENASKQYSNALEQVDKEIIRKATVIGMTTSGAARYQSVLREIGPKIIIVEEAAEVLEAHIITTLSKGCEHLILIGDHKQLRPNPTVYKLVVKYNLDISLFERMVKNGMRFNCLELQHRMRPEISSVMRHIYPDLKDHEHVKSYPNVKGISTNLFFVNHSHLESSDGDIKSYSNRMEAEYAVALCRYLLLQGYENHEITVLTTYTGQLMCMKNLMPKDEFDGVKVTVVDNYQGEENEIVILSLVRSNAANKIGFLKTENRICVALSRAKIGFYVIGNFGHLAEHSDLWKDIAEDMKKKKCIGEGLSLYCQNHPNDNALIAKNHEDFKKAPEGGCRKKCDLRLNCGHTCERFCHVVDLNHETEKSRCKKACTKTCEFGHKCLDKCFMECRPCAVPMIKTIPACEHSQTVPCGLKPENFVCQATCEKKLKCDHLCQNLCGMKHTSQCMVRINFTWSCEHSAVIMCWETESKLCPQPCRTELKCGHKCNGTCGMCLMGRIHKPCRAKTMFTLNCGHKCETYCQNDPVCTRFCEIACDHERCTRRCFIPCQPCKRLCSWKCQHYRCSRLCSDVCDRPRCNKPCNKPLKCKHKCIGLCGEPCPTICKKCDKKKFEKIVFGDHFKPNAKFVLIEDCGHLVESFSMDKYMLEVKEVTNISLKNCPMCKTPIRRCKRYGSIIKQVLIGIERSKKDAIGDVSMINDLHFHIDRLTFGNGKDSRIYRGIETGHISTKEALNVYPCHYFKWVCKKEFRNRLGHSYRREITKRQSQTLQEQFNIALKIIDIQQNIMDNDDRTTKSKPKAEQDYILLLQAILLNIAKPRDILTTQESEDFGSEIQKGTAYVKLLKNMSELNVTEKGNKANEDVLKIQTLVFGNRKLTKLNEKEIERGFENLSRLNKNGEISVAEAKKGRSSEQLAGQRINSLKKCASGRSLSGNEKTCTSKNTDCSVDKIHFGDHEFDFLSTNESSNKEDTGVCFVQDIQAGDFDQSSANEPARIETDTDTEYACLEDDIVFDDYDDEP